MTSKTIDKWANALVLAAVLCFIISFLSFLFYDDAPSGSFFVAGCWASILAPLFRGMSVLVQNAEEQIAAREKEEDAE